MQARNCWIAVRCLGARVFSLLKISEGEMVDAAGDLSSARRGASTVVVGGDERKFVDRQPGR
jgi:hypothetical protein